MTTADITIRAQFCELDPMNVVWHGHYARYLDCARYALFDAISQTDARTAEAGLAWPVVGIRVKYLRSIHEAQQVVVAATLKGSGDQITIDYLILDRQTGGVLTKACTVQMADPAGSVELARGRWSKGRHEDCMLSAEVSIRSQYYDADPMQRVWYGNYARYFEHARYALLERLSYNHTDMTKSGYMWPIVELGMTCSRHVRLTQLIQVQANLVECDTRIKIEYRIHDQESAALCTTAHTAQVAVSLASGERCFRPPQSLKKNLEALNRDFQEGSFPTAARRRSAASKRR